ncbi:hypothetical protein HDV05_001862 [Chytridiales sp. JEL 0842]|nr:hypothetical protein HDV05_001862 [Chytridiales sp. JEL 0842]
MSDGLHGRKKEPRAHMERSEKQRLKELERIEEYNDLCTKAKELRSQGLFDSELFDLTTRILNKNPEYYSVWNWRRIILKVRWESITTDQINQEAMGELRLVEEAVRTYPKSYWLWNHRVWVLLNMPGPNWTRELKLVNMMLDLDPRNFHGWDYRRFVVRQAGLQDSASEIEYTTKKIEQNFSNFSAWHYRSKMIPRVLTTEDERKRLLEEDFERVRNAIYTEPNDQKPRTISVIWAKIQKLHEKLHLTLCFNNHLKLHPKKVRIKLNQTKLTFENSHVVSNRPDVNLVVDDSNTIRWSNLDLIDLEIEFDSGAFAEFMDTRCVTFAKLTGRRQDPCLRPSSQEYTEASRQIDTVPKVDKVVLNRELQSIKELLELEPDCKWPLLMLVYILKEIGGLDDEAIGALQHLKKIDRERIGYYNDCISDIIWDSKTKVISKTSTINTFKAESQQLRRIHAPHIVGYIENSLAGLESLPFLVTLSLKDNKIKDLMSLKVKSSRIQSLNLEGNPVCTTVDSKELIKFLKEQIPSVTLLDNKAV